MVNSLELLALLLGLISTVSGGVAWYSGSIRKSYAAERAFGHLQNDIKQLTQNVHSLFEELEDLNRTLIEQKILINAIHNRIEAVASRIDASTSGWARRTE